MSSERLPGKVLRHVGGQPVLGRLLDALGRATSLDVTVVATSVEPDDDAVADWCEARGVPVHRGPLADVATRVADAAREHGLDVVVRISGDSPMLLPSIVDAVTERFAPDVDVVTNVHPRTFPPGQSVEAIRCSALDAALPSMSAAQREHVTTWFYEHADAVRIVNLATAPPVNDVRMVVDTPDDLEVVEAVVRDLDRPHWELGLTELVAAFRAARGNA